MNLTAPKQIVFVIAVIVAIVALIQALTTVLAFIPISAFWTMAVAFLVLTAGVLLKDA